MLSVWLLIAFTGGILRVIDGRGQEWVPIRGAYRSAILFAWGVLAAFYAFDLHWLTLWVGGMAGWALVKGFPDGAWQSWKVMWLHYSAPCVLAIAPVVFLGLEANTWPLWFALTLAVAVYYWFKNVHWPKRGGWWSYATEFLAGAAVYGGIALI